ncbi:MAG: GDSL-type esterase/lipase family protein [Thermodesulfobacteriota bacterium]
MRRIAFGLISIAAGVMGGALILLALGWSTELVPRLATRILHPGAPPWAIRIAYRPAIWYHRFAGVNIYAHTLTTAFTELQNPEGRHNSIGFRTPEYTISHPPDTFRILVIGDSFTYGDGVAETRTFPRILEELFRERADGKGSRVEVIALGVCGSRTPDNVIRLLAHGRELSPDLVVFQHYGNDLEFSPLYSYGRYFFAATHPVFPERLPLLGRFFRKKPAGQRLADRLRGEDIYSMRLEEKRRMLKPGSFERALFDDCLDTVARFRDETKTPVAFVAFPLLDSTPEGKNFSRYAREPEEQLLDRGPLADIRERGFPLLDLRETYKAEAGDRYLAVSRQNGHPNDLAHRLAAEALFSFLQENGLASCPSPPGKPAGPGFEREQALRDSAASRWKEYAGDLDLQMKFFTDLCALHPKNAWLREQLAFCAFSAGNGNLARTAWEKTAALAPAQAAPWAYLAMTFPVRFSHSFLRLLSVCPPGQWQETAMLAPGLAAPWYFLAFADRGATDRERFLTKMLAVLPRQNLPLLTLARYYAEQGRNRDACGLYSRAARAAEYPGNFEQAMSGLHRLSCPAFPEPVEADFQGKPPEAGAEQPGGKG